jgi:hypothetical protein
MTLENWNSLLYANLSSKGYSIGYQSVLFMVSWIIIGNYILLNLFLGILLEGFGTGSEEDMD